MKPIGNPEEFGFLWEAFSILERIDVGETIPGCTIARVNLLNLSVSSNGSTWVKLSDVLLPDVSVCFPFSILERIDVGETIRRRLLLRVPQGFQYPRTDRRG